MVQQYLEHLKQILINDFSGYKPNRTGIDSISLFGYQNQYDLAKGFPLLTTKKMFTRAIIHELIWFLRGDTNIKYLIDNNVHIWDGNAFQHYLKKKGLDKEIPMYSEKWHEMNKEFIGKIKEDAEFAKQWGDLGEVYGKQWRKWKTSDGKEIDQISDAINLLKNKPNDRRIIVTAWNPEEVKNMALPPCHTLFHLNVLDGKLDCQLYQRSCDMFLGVPFNIASYSMLTCILAAQTGLKPGRFIHTFGDSHIYCGADKRGKWYGDKLTMFKEKIKAVKNREEYLEVKNWIEENSPVETEGKLGQDHMPAVLEQLSREPKSLPKFKISEGKAIEELSFEDFVIEEYESHPPIKASMAV